MTIDRIPDPIRPAKNPEETSEGKRKAPDDLEKSPLKKLGLEQEQSHWIEKGPFKGLPLPLQKKGIENNFPYIACNELDQIATLKILKENPSAISPERRVHIGFSVWFNLDLMAVTKPSFGILCDIDDKMMVIYQGIIESLAKSANQLEFIRIFDIFLIQNLDHLFGLSPEEMGKIFNIRNEPKRPDSWLASDGSFQVIKNLFQKEHILFLNLDITDTQGAFPNIRKWLDENKLELDTLYASNIIDWLKDSLKQQAYVLNLKTIATQNTRFIQAYANAPVKPKRGQQPAPKQEPIQYIVKGVDNITVPPKLKA